MKLITIVTVLSIATEEVTASSAFLSSPSTAAVLPEVVATSAASKKLVSIHHRAGGLKMRMSASSATASEATPNSKANEQTISAAAFNLIKGCVGSGVLSLPAGVAAIGDVPKA